MRMRMKKYGNSSIQLIGLRANEEEQKMFQLIMKARKIPSKSHVIRVLVTEEAEKILASQSPAGVN